jgi:hypothetical protein
MTAHRGRFGITGSQIRSEQQRSRSRSRSLIRRAVKPLGLLADVLMMAGTALKAVVRL